MLHEPHQPHYNYYISDRDSVSEHIYEVIDDTYDVIKHSTAPVGNSTTHCRGNNTSVSTRNSNVYYHGSCNSAGVSGDPVLNNLVTIKLDKLNTIKSMQNENYYRQFNSLKTFRTHRTRDPIMLR